MSSAKQSLVDGPILSTLLRLSAPNVVALSASAVITIAETAYVGRLGVASLAGVALVFPIVMLMQMMSAGAMGGTISGAISRAIGAGNSALAAAVACNAAVIGAAAGTLFAGLLWLLGPLAFRALGGSGAALAEATAYAQVVAPAFIFIWLANTFASIARGMGVMSQPALILLAAGGLQITAGGALAFGFGFLPAWGVAGVAAGQVVAFALAAMVMLRLLKSPRVPLVFSFDISLINTKVMAALLRPGLLACLSPIQSVATVLVLTAIVARFGEDALAGYSVGSRLEFLLIPVAFAIGVGSVPMVGTAIGSGNVARARRVAWLAGALAAAALAIIGMIVAIAPDVWARIFVSDGPVLEVTREYLQIASIGYPFFGLALCLYFAAQGAAKVGGVIIAQTIRLVLIITGGWIILSQAWPLWTVFALSALAMFVQGMASLVAIRLSNWAPQGAKP